MTLRLARFSSVVIATLASLVGCGHHDSGQPGPGDGNDGGTDSGGVPVTGTQSIKGLSAPVDVMRDKTGMVHIYAKSAVDAFRVEGYQVARDRTFQLELVRRSAIGSIAEL